MSAILKVRQADGSVVEIPAIVGPPGPAGSDASVTADSIKSALGYTPADEKAVYQLSEAIDNEQGLATEAMRATTKKVKAYQRPDSLTLTLMSDTHYTSTDKNATKKLATARLMSQMCDFYNIDLIGNLGDLIPGKDTLDVAKNDLMDIVGATAHNNRKRIAVVRGNHDENGWYSQGGYGGSYTPNDSLDDLGQYQYIDSLNDGLVRDKNRPTGGYGYYDHEPSKIRVFLLNTSDIPYILEADGSYRYTTYGFAAFSNEQINFVADALKFADKDTPNEWAALFLMHVPMDTTNNDGYRFGMKDALIRGVTQMLNVITAYKNGSSYQFSGSVYNVSSAVDVPEDFMVNVNVDYSDKGEGDVIAFISGHTHADNYSNEVGVERSPSRGYAFLSVMGATEFSNIIVNRADNSISVVKHGQSFPDKTEGATVVSPAVGSVESGEWTVYFDQFRPEDNGNIFTGWDSYGKGHNYDPDNIWLDFDTMELTSHIEQAAYICSKAVPVTPNTTYKIPSGWIGTIISFNVEGGKSNFPAPVAADGYKTVTTLGTHYYLVFAANWYLFEDYENMTVEQVV